MSFRSWLFSPFTGRRLEKKSKSKSSKSSPIIWDEVRLYNPSTGKYSDGHSQLFVKSWASKYGTDDVYYKGSRLSRKYL